MHETYKKKSRILVPGRLLGRRPMNYETRKMFQAVRQNRVHSVKRLLQTGKVDLEAREAYPGNGFLHLSVYFGHVNIAKLLLRAGCRVNAWNLASYSPLHLAVHNFLMKPKDRLDILRYVLQYGGNVNADNLNGDAPLHAMVKSNASRVDAVKLLRDHEADIRRTNNQNNMPFHEYVCNREVWHSVEHPVLKLLYPDDPYAMRRLHKACLFCEWENVKQMVVNGEDVNEEDDYGRSPLYYAIIADNNGGSNEEKILIIKLLLDHGADFTKKIVKSPRKQETLIDHAYGVRDTDAVKILLMHVVKISELHFASDNCSEIVDYLKFLSSENLETIRAVCVSEIKAMTEMRLADSSITFIDVLKASPSKAMNFTRNADLVKKFESSGYAKSFPTYEGMLRAVFHKGLVRLQLTRKAAVLLSENMDLLDSGHLIFETMLAYLSDEELKILVHSG